MRNPLNFVVGMYTKYIPDFESLLIPASISPWQHWMSRLNLSYFFACLSCTSFPKQCRFCLIWLLGIVVQQPELFWNLKCAAQCGNLKCTDSCINQIPELLWLRWSVSDCAVFHNKYIEEELCEKGYFSCQEQIVRCTPSLHDPSGQVRAYISYIP